VAELTAKPRTKVRFWRPPAPAWEKTPILVLLRTAVPVRAAPEGSRTDAVTLAPVVGSVETETACDAAVGYE
jgi:hypothetical protein